MPTYAKGNKFITKVTVPKTVDPRGRINRMTDTEAAGAAWEHAVKSAILSGKAIPEPEGKSLSVGGADAGTMGQLARSVHKLHWQGKKDPKSGINADVFVRWVGEKTAPSEALTTGKIEEFVEDYLMGERNVSGATINRYLSAVNTLAKFAGKKLSEKPDIAHLWHEEGEGRIRWFTEEEEKLVLQTWLLWSKNVERDFFIFLIDTGARPFAEGVRLEWRDVGKRSVTFWETKNGKARTVPLTTRAVEAIERQRGRGLSGPFVDIDKDQITRLWNRTRAHLPALKDAVLYTCRHTCASRLVQGGVDLARVKLWMGHKRIETTMRYSHLAPQHLLDAVAVLEPGHANLKVIGG